MNGNDRKLENWNCEKCDIRIGVVDPEARQVRIRYKDFVLSWEWCDDVVSGSQSDKVSLLCRRCAWVNTKTREELVNTKIKKINSDTDK